MTIIQQILGAIASNDFVSEKLRSIKIQDGLVFITIDEVKDIDIRVHLDKLRVSYSGSGYYEVYCAADHGVISIGLIIAEPRLADKYRDREEDFPA